MSSSFPRDLLRSGERVLWQGQPAQGFRFSARDLVLVPFSILWCGFAITWEVTAARSDAGWTFLLFGAPFVVIGLTIAIGRFAIDRWLRSRTRYALTDRRVLIERDGPCGLMQSVDLTSLSELKLVPGRAGTGTIWLGPQPSLFARGNGFDVWIPSLSAAPQLYAIDGASAVLDRLFHQQEQLRKG